MARNIVYRSVAWHDFHGEKYRTESDVVVIPEHEDRRNAAKAFACSNADALFTIPELIARYLKSRGERGLILPYAAESILGSIIAESFVPYLKMEKYRQSYVRALADFICGFRNTTLEDLDAALADFKTGGLSFKEKDLIKIYREYERRLPDYGYDTRSGLLEFLRHTGGDNIHHHLGLREDRGVVFLGFDYLTPLEVEFIYTVFKYLPRASFLLCNDKEASEQATRTGESVAALLERLNHLGVEYKSLPPKRQGFFIDLSRCIFRPESTASIKACMPEPAVDTGAGRTEPRGIVTISQANSRFQEIVSIARQIRQLSGTGISLSDIRVVAPEYHLYSSIIGEVFPGYGLPFFPEQGVPLLQYPAAAVILQLVNQGVSPNPYPLREKILSSPYIRFSDEVRPKDLAAYQEACGVELLSRERLNTCLQPGSHRLDFHYIRNIRQEAYRSVKPVPGTSPLEVARRFLNGAGRENAGKLEDHLCRCLVQFYLLAQAEKALSAWPARMSGEGFAQTLRRLLERFQVAENVVFVGDSPPAPQVRERDRAVLGRIHELLDEMVSSLAAAAKAPVEKYTMAELARLFSRLLGDSSLHREEYDAVSDDAVSIQPVNRGQYKEWGYTFICGMVDGEFPAAEEFNFLQPKKEGLGLGRTYTSVDYDRGRFYRLIRSTTDALFLSRPLSDNGRRLPPSPFLMEIEKCVPSQPRDTENTDQDAGRNRLYSQREKLLFIGKNADHDYDSVWPLLKELKNEDQAFWANTVEILRFDGLTLNAGRFSEFDGLFPPAASSLATLAKDIGKINFTPSVLERYAACPLRFFFDDILRLKQRPDYDPDTTETGLLVRSLLKEYTAKACACRGVPDDAPFLFQKAVEQYVMERERDGVDAFQARFSNGLTAGLDSRATRPRGLLCAFLEHERNGPDLLSPYLAALAGPVTLDGMPNVWVETDRVDLAEETGCLLPFIYTVAGAGDPGRIRRGLRFDLPLAIMLVMNYVVENKLNLTVAGAGLYQVKTAKTIRRGGYFAASEVRATRQANVSPQLPVFSGQREGLMERDKFAGALEKCREHILRLYRLMHKGVFHPPLCFAAEQTCHNCSFGRLCRKDQLRLEKLRNSAAGDELSGEKLNLIRDIL